MSQILRSMALSQLTSFSSQVLGLSSQLSGFKSKSQVLRCIALSQLTSFSSQVLSLISQVSGLKFQVSGLSSRSQVSYFNSHIWFSGFRPHLNSQFTALRSEVSGPQVTRPEVSDPQILDLWFLVSELSSQFSSLNSQLSTFNSQASSATSHVSGLRSQV